MSSSRRSGRVRPLSSSSSDSEEETEAPSSRTSATPRSQSQAQSSQQQLRGGIPSGRSPGVAGPSGHGITGRNPELESTFMYDQRTIAKASGSRSIRQQLYGDLFLDAQGFQDRDGVGGFDLRHALTENAIKGGQLGAIPSALPSDMFNAIRHANLCTKMLRFHSEKVGDQRNFKVDAYLMALMRGAGGDRDLLTRGLVKIFGKSAAIGFTPYALVGSFDREPGAVKQEKKKGAARRKRVFDADVMEATQYQEQGDEEGAVAAGGKGKAGNVAEEVCTRLNKVLKYKSRERASSYNYFEFALNKESLDQTVQNMFYTGFLIRDGHASLTASDPQHGSGATDLILKPDKPPKKNGELTGAGPAAQQGIARNQHIVSFSAKIYREMLAAAKGETEIPPGPEVLINGEQGAAAQGRSRIKKK